MPVSYRILAERSLVYVRYEGVVRFADTARAFSAYAQDPDMRNGQHQLVDLARVTDWERDFATLLKMQAEKADVFLGSGHEMLFVYYAPTDPARAMAQMVLRSWEDIPGVIPLVQETEADALHVLGRPEATIDALLQKV